jgi:hypothetical protein
MAQQLINAYAERFYRYTRGRWEAPYLEVVDVDENDASIPGSYVIESTDLVQTSDEIDQIRQFVADLRAALKANSLAPWSQENGRWRTVPFGGHLYQPLLHVGKNSRIRVSPVPLDKWEADFVRDLATWSDAHRDQEVYLLRNQAVTGLGFFQASNFFPDFLLWTEDGDREHLAFVDPKGLHHPDLSDPKVQFATHDIPRLQEIVSRHAPNLRLHAFILSNTAFSDLEWSDAEGTLLTKQEVRGFGVLFQVDDPTTYIDALMQAIRTPSPATSSTP